MPASPQTATKVSTSSVVVAIVTAAAGLGLIGMAAGLLPGVSSGRPDLNATVVASSQYVSVPGEAIDYTVLVKNDGTVTSGPFVLTKELSKGQVTVVSTSLSGGTCTQDGSTITCLMKSLAAGSSSSVSIKTKLAASSLSCGQTGTIVSSVTVDPGGLTGDSNTKNNVGTTRTTMEGSCIATANLTVSDVSVASMSGIITATLKNTGTTDVAGPVNVYFYFDGVRTWTYTSSTLADQGFLKAGGTSTVSPQKVDATTKEIRVCVDDGDAVAEFDESDNCFQKTVVVATPEGIDLTVKKSGSVPSAKQGESVVYMIAVTNSGTVAATSVGVTDAFTDPFVYVSATGTDGFACSLSAKTVVCKGGMIAAGKTATITVTGSIGSTGLACDTTKTISDVATADPLNKIVETDETNNKSTAQTILTNPCSGSSVTTTTTTTTDGSVSSGTTTTTTNTGVSPTNQ